MNSVGYCCNTLEYNFRELEVIVKEKKFWYVNTNRGDVKIFNCPWCGFKLEGLKI
jgi:hypothetical protein